LVINDNDFIEKAEIIREKGTNRSQFNRGETSKYTWVSLGSSFLPSDIIAAFLYAQLEDADIITKKRHDIFEYYYNELLPLEQKGSLRLPFIPDSCKSNGHLFFIICRSKKERDRLISFLNKEGVNSVFHYIPLHSSPMGRVYRKLKTRLPVTDQIADHIVRLPCYYGIKTSELHKVVQTIISFFNCNK
jgi:dTDP-4-amino-4,6-dideoxygalactose transaminase